MTQIRLVKDGKVIYEGKNLPIRNANKLDNQRISTSGSLSLGSKMESGDYILQVITTDNLASKKRQTVSQFVPFEIIE